MSRYVPARHWTPTPLPTDADALRTHVSVLVTDLRLAAGRVRRARAEFAAAGDAECVAICDGWLGVFATHIQRADKLCVALTRRRQERNIRRSKAARGGVR